MGVGATNKGYMKVVETGKIKKFQFNPSGLSDSQVFDFASLRSPCSAYPKFQYVGTGERSFSLQLFLYGTKGEPQDYLNFFESLKPKNRFDMPKIIVIAMGSDVRTCIVTGISREISEYNADLSVKMAVVTLSLTEV